MAVNIDGGAIVGSAISISLAACVVTLFIFFSSCTQVQETEVTKRVQAACQGDLNADGARTAACIEALRQGRSTGGR